MLFLVEKQQKEPHQNPAKCVPDILSPTDMQLNLALPSGSSSVQPATLHPFTCSFIHQATQFYQIPGMCWA